MEDISKAATREVFEETGITSKYIGLLGFRYFYPTFLGQEDISFVCLLQAESKDIQMDKEELSDCKWFKISQLPEITFRSSDEEIKIMVQDYLKNNKLIQNTYYKTETKEYYFYKV